MFRILAFCFSVCLASLLSGCSHPEERFTPQAQVLLSTPTLALAEANLKEAAITPTAHKSERSVGGIHDFYSEGDYWWPDSASPEGPYIRRDGLSNPDNFNSHRESLIRFSELTGNLTSAYLLTGEERFAKAALAHCRAWFITDSTHMSPHLLYAQAIKGRHTGRGIGIIDAVHFMDVVQSLRVLEREGQVDAESAAGFKSWVSAFLTWLTTHPYGLKEMVHPNNHGTWWNAQVGLYAAYVGEDSIYKACQQRFVQDLLPRQMAADGSYPLEQERTKPYAYSLFNLDASVMNCFILSDETLDLWKYQTPEGKSITLGLDYMAPFITDKNNWPLPADVMYPDAWPVAQPSFILGAVMLNREDYYQSWAPFEQFPEVFEVKRAQPIHSPLVWLADVE